jgi:hypothetical protein
VADAAGDGIGVAFREIELVSLQRLAEPVPVLSA